MSRKKRMDGAWIRPEAEGIRQRDSGGRKNRIWGFMSLWSVGVSRTGPSAVAWGMMKPSLRWSQKRGASWW